MLNNSFIYYKSKIKSLSLQRLQIMVNHSARASSDLLILIWAIFLLTYFDRHKRLSILRRLFLLVMSGIPSVSSAVRQSLFPLPLIEDNMEYVEVNSPRWFDLKDLKDEIWSEFGCEGFLVSNYGRIKGLSRIIHVNDKKGKSYTIHAKERILKTFLNKGYLFFRRPKTNSTPSITIKGRGSNGKYESKMAGTTRKPPISSLY